MSRIRVACIRSRANAFGTPRIAADHEQICSVRMPIVNPAPGIGWIAQGIIAELRAVMRKTVQKKYDFRLLADLLDFQCALGDIPRTIRLPAGPLIGKITIF